MVTRQWGIVKYLLNITCFHAGIASRLAICRCSVTVIGRNEERGKEVVDELKLLSNQRQGSDDDMEAPEYHFQKLDVSLLGNIQQFCNEYKTSNKGLDFLVMTQGIATIQGDDEIVYTLGALVKPFTRIYPNKGGSGYQNGDALFLPSHVCALPWYGVNPIDVYN